MVLDLDLDYIVGSAVSCVILGKLLTSLFRVTFSFVVK